MRAIPIVVFSALTLIAAVSSSPAQTTAPQGTSLPAASKPATAAPNPLDAENVSGIAGTSVYGTNDENIGHVSDVLMSPDTKKIDRLVVASGGVLGVGSHRVALGLDEFTWDSTKAAFKI